MKSGDFFASYDHVGIGTGDSSHGNVLNVIKVKCAFINFQLFGFQEMQQACINFLPHEGIFFIFLNKYNLSLIICEGNVFDKILDISGRRT